MSDRDDILNTGLQDKGKEPDQALMMAYLEGKLSPEEQHRVELWLSEEGMGSDAIEGLQMLPVEETKQTVNRLNNELHKTLRNKKKKRRKTGSDVIVWTTVITILVLAVVAYLVIKLIL